jgi:hypothetical protein
MEKFKLIQIFKIKNLVKLITLLLITTSSCSFKRNSFENYQGTINEILNPNASNLAEIQNIADVRDMRGCGFDIELGSWYKNKNLSKPWKEVWSRPVSEYDHGIIGSGNQYVDFDPKDSTPHLTKNPLIHIVYIGPWHYSKKVGKEIRFVAYTGWGGGDISYQFESKTPENQNILSKEYNLPEKGKTYQRTQICIVKWIANHGYNAIAQVRYEGIINKVFHHTPIATGKIIEVED